MNTVRISTESENTKKNQTELKNTITEILKKRNTLEGINSRLDDTQDWLRKLEDRVVEIT